MDSPALEKIVQWMTTEIPAGFLSLSVAGILLALLTLLATFPISSLLQRVISRQVIERMGLEAGAAYAVRRVLHYMVILVGAILAATFLGADLTGLAVVVGFLGVGIGFGLQNVTSNFISGLILLFERPISVGDYITGGGQDGTVADIKIRSTLIKTLDNVTIIIPNSNLLENEIINWSIGDTRIRLHVTIGVAYGSDVPRVTETLLRVAAANADVLETPAPDVRFINFGDSSLDFELLVWLDFPEKRWSVESALNFAIDDAFRQENITIPFPQRDLHVMSAPGLEAFSGRAPSSN